MNAYRLKAGDRAMVLPTKAFIHLLNPMDIVEVHKEYNKEENEYEVMGFNYMENKITKQWLFPYQLLPLSPHHTGFPDQLDAE